MAQPKYAVVTGAGSGIGRAASLALQRAGYSVALAGRRAAQLEETTSLGTPEGGRMLPVVTDVASPSFGLWNGSVSAPRNMQVGGKFLF